MTGPSEGRGFHLPPQIAGGLSDICKATYSAFWVHERRGTILPHSTAKVYAEYGLTLQVAHFSRTSSIFVLCVCVCVCAYIGVGDLPATRPGLLLTDLGPAGRLNGNLASFPGPAVFWGRGLGTRLHTHLHRSVHFTDSFCVM